MQAALSHETNLYLNDFRIIMEKFTITERDPFYSEENMECLDRSIEQLKRGQTVEFDLHEFIKENAVD